MLVFELVVGALTLVRLPVLAELLLVLVLLFSVVVVELPLVDAVSVVVVV